MASPSSEVFATFELLEMILSNLAMRDLLASQRVSYVWNQAIKTSRDMQRSKFLLADKPKHLSPIYRHHQSNPLYLQRFVQQAAFYALRQVNPTVQFMGMDRFVLRRVIAFDGKEASWRRMLLFQPRTSVAVLTPMSAKFEGNNVYFLRNEEGLTMADVVIFFEEMAKAGGEGIELLSATVVRRMVWSITPVAPTTA
ncbi:hypothetical protein FKW77_000386 [Venturia effusa]|uniref:F-box domain-containing protein n=1 Tax=Venturia effusa TaxID=50376 RepID=A0A517LHW8_9PEZI|nr:hypothetical protein FKW77_000386 [Venturia effusa]